MIIDTANIKGLFWLALLRYAYKKTGIPEERMPVGIPGNRDPNARCDGFAPRNRFGSDFTCDGDGHYLCKECAHHKKEEEDEDT